MPDLPRTHRRIDTRFSSDKIRVDYAHVGLMDVTDRKIWIARKRWGVLPVRVSHARLLMGGGQDTSTADKDRFLCFWYHTPGSGEGFVHGYPIEWDEGHLLVRLDPNWNYHSQKFVPNTETAKIEANIEQQYRWGKYIFESYVAKHPGNPLSWHLIGPRPADSLFYIQRVEGFGQ
ncbi:MAG: hypothetical protein JJU36_11840 [Phycisphaeraceae bacterium]|nr:hypothetical protein [Phycisphaeraceae bacterium]